MAWLITGERGTVWRGAEWVARNAMEFMIPSLGAAGATALARACIDALERPCGLLELGELLERDGASQAWERAVDAALALAEDEPRASWREPQRRPEFLVAMRRLGALASGGGNALVVDLADAQRYLVDLA